MSAMKQKGRKPKQAAFLACLVCPDNPALRVMAIGLGLCPLRLSCYISVERIRTLVSTVVSATS